MDNWYIPSDYQGPVEPCNICGNDAPVRQIQLGRVFEDSAFAVGALCSACFIGGVQVSSATHEERKWLITELLDQLEEDENG